MYFSVSGVTVAPWIPFVVAFVISAMGATSGISGAFLLLPFQMSFLGYTTPSVSATNQVFNIVAIPSGIYRYIKEKRMLWPLAFVIVCGTLPGVFLGAVIRIIWLPQPFVFKCFAAAIMFYLGWRLWQGGLRVKPRNIIRTSEKEKSGFVGAVVVNSFTMRRILYIFNGHQYACSVPRLLIVSLFIGLVGGAYGVGGGAIMAPLLVSWFRLPVHTLGGATLLGTFITSVAGVVFYSFLAKWFPFVAVKPDWFLGLLFGAGGFLGMYCGARVQKYLAPECIQWLLFLIIMGTALCYLYEFYSVVIQS